MLSLKLVPCLFSIILIPTTYYFGKCLYNEKIGLLSAMFVSIPPDFFFKWSLAARGGFIEFLVVFTLMGSLFWSIFVKENNSLVKISLFGFVCGLSLWIYQTVVIYFIIFFILAIPKLKSMRTMNFIVPFSLCFLIGSFPFVIFQIFHPLATAEVLSIKFFEVEASEYYKHGVVGSLLSGIISQMDPIFWINNCFLLVGGEIDRLSDIFRFHNLIPILLGIIVLKFLFQHLKTTWKFNLKNFEGLDFLILFFIITFIVGHSKARYLLPCYILVVVIYSYFIVYIKKKKWYVFFIALLLVANSIGTIGLLWNGPGNIKSPRSYKKVIDFLEKEGLYYGYSGFYTGYPINFLSGERITISAKCGPFFTDRYLRYRKVVESADSVFYIFDNESTADKIFQEELSRLKIYCNKKKIQKFNIYYAISQRESVLIPSPVYNPDLDNKRQRS